MEKKTDKKRTISSRAALSWIVRVVKGAIIGVGAILPGISGGVLCVVLGIYEPMMAFLAHPIRSFKGKFGFFLPVVLGYLAGFLLLARVVEWLFRTSTTPATWLFIGLIAGTLPSLFRQAGQKGRNVKSFVSFGVCLAIMLAALLYVQRAGVMRVEPNFFWWLLCGVLWGVGLVVPGMSPSSFFIFLGLYQPMTAGIADLSIAVLGPLALGIALSVALLAKAVGRLMQRHTSVFFHGILGVLIASTLAILPVESATGAQIALYGACFLLGALAAYFTDFFGSRLKEKLPKE